MVSGTTDARGEGETPATHTVFHVDDDQMFLELTQGVLGQEGVEVVSESDPRAVLDRLDSVTVDAVVSDYEMPEMDGGALFERVRRHHPSLPFVLFTGKDREELATDLTTDDASWYVQKRGPGGYDRLVSVVQDAVDHRTAAGPVASDD